MLVEIKMKVIPVILKSLKPLLPALYMSLILLVVFFVGRLVACFIVKDIISDLNELIYIFLSGLRIDLSAIGWISVLMVLLTTFSSLTKISWKLYRPIYILLLSAFVTFSIFMEGATPAFIEEYGVRPNRFFVEYLIYPKEVFNMLWQGRPAQVILGIVLLIVIPYFSIKFFNKNTQKEYTVKWWVVLFMLPILVAVGILAGRSSLGHRPINPAMVAFSTDPTINEVVLNSSYSVVYAASRMKKSKSAIDYYGDMNEELLLALVKQNSHRKKEQYEPANTDAPTLSLNKAEYSRDKPLNIVILLQESFGAQFIKTLGGKDLSPNFDELSKEGWLFSNAFATGTRSIRGIEAVVAGFPPTPITAVVKLDKAQSNFFTLPSLLNSMGYNTSFIYGGETHFDNMKTFFLGNGVKQVIGQEDYENPSFVGSWGVSDEDLYNKADQVFSELHSKNKPFFSIVFSSSNHDPFEFPDNKIELYDQEKNTRNNAVKYADYAIGEFFKKAKKQSYYKDTIFLVIADHDSRVTGKTSVPYGHYHIPALILGADIKARNDKRMVSQIDMAPTLLSLAGISAEYPMIGQDLCDEGNGGRALLQFNNNFAYMVPGKVVLFAPDKKPQTYLLKSLDSTPVITENDQEFTQMGHAMSIIGDYLYTKELYGSKYLNTKEK